MESSGFEPEAPALQGRCSTVELQPHDTKHEANVLA